MAAKTFYDILKGNPYHDEKGRFTTGPKARNPMIRTEPPPKKTKIAYKVFMAKDGKLYPPMVANPDGQATPVGVWLNASEGKMATDKDGNPITNTLGRNKVKAGGKGTQGGSGTLAYRPGWHLGELPEAKQFYTKDKVTGEKKQKKNFVWAECEIAADFNYQDEAMSYGYNKNGKFQHSLAGLPKIPKDGYYTYRTNPDPTTQPWYITGAMKVNRILTDAETNSILRSHGIEPMKRDGGELDLKALGFTETNFVNKSGAAIGSTAVAKTFDDILKFNPYHDSRGRFATAGSYATFTYAPGKSKAHDLAIERQKQRMAGIMPSAAQEKTLKGIESRTRNLKKEQFRVVDREGNVIMQKQGGKDSVSYSVGEARDNFPGNVTIHNHPDGGTFSSADLSDIGYGATEIRAAAPEGTYILRNMRHGARYDAAKEKTWYDMRNDVDAASEGFKTYRQMKSEIRKPFDAQVDPIAQKFVSRKNAGASQDELNQIYAEYTSKVESFRPQIEAAARKAYVDQYHHWYNANAGKYGLEYEFIPVQTRAR